MNDMKNVLMQLNKLKYDLWEDGLSQESGVVANAMNFIETNMSNVNNHSVTKFEAAVESIDKIFEGVGK